MGAILAILGEAGDPELSERLQRMLARSPYRGEPEFVVEGPLAIGIQSMGWDASLHSAGNWLVAFHGYIGNWVELVPSNGWRFPEDSNNAHKVAISYEILGDALFAKLRGEWAVVIWDRHKKNLLAARDVIGCRPMFRQAFRSRVFFATEVRQVLAGSGAPVEIDIETFRRFLHFEPNRNRSSVCGVHQIPACRLWGSGVDHDGPRSEPFFRFGSEWQQLSGIGVDAAAEVVHDRLETAVTRASAGRPVGVALSGGLDSSTVWGIVNKLGSAEADHPDIAAFCLRFPGRAEDEGDYMEAVFADRPGMRTDIRMLSSKVLPRLKEAAERADTPYLANIISQLELARSARADGRRIVLTGHGGDWAFQGNIHDLEHAVLCEREPAAAWWATRFVFGQRMFGRACRRLVRHLARRNPITPPSSERGSEQVTSGGLSAEVRALWGEADDAYGEAGRRSMLEGLAIEQAGWHLTPSEQVSAAFGVEIRHPLLDLDLLEGALSVAQKLHLARGFHKGLLRMAAAPVLPEKVCSRKGEIGLSGFLIDGLSPVAREHPGVNCALRESTRFMGGLSGIAVGFGDEFVVPLRLLIDDLTRRGQLPDYRGMEE